MSGITLNRDTVSRRSNGHAAARPAVAPPPPPKDPKLRVLHNAIMAMTQNDRNVFWPRNGGGGLEPNLDRWSQLDNDLGYPTDDNPELYARLYARGGIASRVVNLWPDECFAYHPDMYQTEEPRRTRWERAWETKVVPHDPWHFIHRADRLSGVASFGVMLLGLPGNDLTVPAQGIDPDTGEWSAEPPPETDLLYLQTFGAPLVRVTQSEKKSESPRFMQPTEYEIQFAFPGSGAGSGGPDLVTNKVHWTRVIHLADNRGTSNLYGVPRARPVLNYLYDVRKVAGSSGEMFYKGGFPGYAFEAYPDVVGSESETDMDAVEEEIYRYTRGLQRYLTSIGGKWNSLAVQVASPKDHIDVYLQLICATIGVPVRIFTGAESGHLASTQDAVNWKERVKGRQTNYLDPMVVRPFVDRLMGVGVLPRVRKYIIDWKDLRALSNKDKADVGLKQIQALFQYITGNVDQALPRKILWTQIMGFSEDQARAIEQELLDNPPPPPMFPPTGAAGAGQKPGSQAGGRTGTAARASAGRPAGGPPSGQPRSATTPAGRRAKVHAS